MKRSCKNCFYQEQEISEYPCSNCKHAYADLWKPKNQQNINSTPKEVRDFKVLRKGDKVRKYYNGVCIGDYIVLHGRYNNGLTIISCEHIFSGVPECIHVNNLVKLVY